MSFGSTPPLSPKLSSTAPSGAYNPAINQYVADNAHKFFGGSLENAAGVPHQVPNYQNQLLPGIHTGGFAPSPVASTPPKFTYLPIGEVMIVPLNNPIQPGFRSLTYAEGQTYKEQLKGILSEWSIVAFDHGQLRGSGYGYEVKEVSGT